MVEFRRPDGKTAPGYFAPAAKVDAPGVVLFEEWWGVDDRIKETADRLASQDFDVVVPDVFRGRSAATPDLAATGHRHDARSRPSFRQEAAKGRCGRSQHARRCGKKLSDEFAG